CMFSRNVKLMTSDGHDILRDGKRINPAKSIYIGSHVWLADNVTILKGVDIGSGSIIGINSTVTKSIGQYCIAAGNPARKIKDNISWNTTLSY
ncbi:acyltransferase, partial [Vibrio cholerae]